MNREAEPGILRAVQTWIAAESRAILDFSAAGVHFVAEDEGDYETELDKRINRGEICCFISTPLMRKISLTERHALVSMKVFESVALHRSRGAVVPWTALRLAERLLATFDSALMDVPPWAHFYAEPEAITLESQSPWLVYEVKMVGKMILKRTT